MPQQVSIYPRNIVDQDDKNGSVLVPTTGATTRLVFGDGQSNFRTRTGRRCFISFIGNAVDPGGETQVMFHVLVNGARLQQPYDSFQQAMGLTYDGNSNMNLRLEVPQNAMIEVTAENADTATAYNAFIRMRVDYEEL